MSNPIDKLQSRYITPSGCKGCGKHPLYSFDPYSDISAKEGSFRWVEVRFKNTRKEIFFNPQNIPLQKEDVVAVEGAPGLDIGIVSLVGIAAELRRAKDPKAVGVQPKQIFRIATANDMERYEAAKALEHSTMIQSRQIAVELGLDMKIGDVEYQGDGTKAIFYYIADGRVDFRKLIRVLANTFHIRVEMKQIGARQETGRIGGIGPCGRKLCCSSWMTQFHSVGTYAARIQDLSLNPDKLTGQCGKLKCCNNFEVESYAEAQRFIPSKDITLTTEEGVYTYVKADVLAAMVTYRLQKEHGAPEYCTISTRRVKHIIELNKQGITPPSLLDEPVAKEPTKSRDILNENEISRFDNRDEAAQARRGKRSERRGNRNRRDNRRGANKELPNTQD